MKSPITRCINLDWLEIYALEPVSESPRNADYFRCAGYIVREREYGTPVYNEMFTIMGHDDLPLLEIRRDPKSKIGEQANGVLNPFATHIRLCNRTCYFENAAELMQQFLEQHHYTLKRISRLDLALDFEYFDSGDDPQKFLNRYINGKYAKVNQSRISLHGLDCWDGRYWNSVKWGSPKSMVNTKMYDKTMEIREQSDKPYIRMAWYAAGLVDDWHTLEKTKQDGTRYKPRIWRVEFSIKSHDKNWFQVENPYNTKPRLRSIKHTLDRYFTRIQMCDVFFSVAAHYFAFKKMEYQDGKSKGADRQLKRKDRCADKVLFDVSAMTTVYVLSTTATSERQSPKNDRLLKYLYEYQYEVTDPKIQRALYTVIESLETRTHTADFRCSLDDETIQALRRLISQRMEQAKNERATERMQDQQDELTVMDLFA